MKTPEPEERVQIRPTADGGTEEVRYAYWQCPLDAYGTTNADYAATHAAGHTEGEPASEPAVAVPTPRVSPAHTEALAPKKES